MKLNLFITDGETGNSVYVDMVPMSKEDAISTTKDPIWQTSWLSEYISDPKKQKYALKTKDNELVALAAYEIQKEFITVFIIYMESHPESNPTMTDHKKYFGIGKALIAYGIALSVNNGCGGCVAFEAKTPELAEHYYRDFGALPLPSFHTMRAPRFIIEGNAAINIISDFLEEGSDSNGEQDH